MHGGAVVMVVLMQGDDRFLRRLGWLRKNMSSRRTNLFLRLACVTLMLLMLLMLLLMVLVLVVQGEGA